MRAIEVASKKEQNQADMAEKRALENTDEAMSKKQQIRQIWLKIADQQK